MVSSNVWPHVSVVSMSEFDNGLSSFLWAF